MKKVYMDYAATTPVDDEVLEDIMVMHLLYILLEEKHLMLLKMQGYKLGVY
jgi:hypothetical protein